ncbi:MAG TPA: hypothetical protein VMQ86_25530 [Bryobacteraceae bacterium]|nr:hypothetical protein [Bryobacteraceae bacterium]
MTLTDHQRRLIARALRLAAAYSAADAGAAEACDPDRTQAHELTCDGQEAGKLADLFESADLDVLISSSAPAEWHYRQE